MYITSDKRYETMKYNRCGKSGLMLPAVSLGLWHNFGDTSSYINMEKLCFTAFDNGITHFDLANNYGPEPGSAEKNFGRILKENFLPYRDEMIISTKAGYTMWEGPYGDWGSRKYLLASLDQSWISPSREWDWSMSISSTITGWIRIRLSKRLWALWSRPSEAAKHFMSVFPTMTGRHWREPQQS